MPLRLLRYIDWRSAYIVTGLELRRGRDGVFSASATVLTSYDDQGADMPASAEMGAVLARLDPPVDATTAPVAITRLVRLLRTLGIVDTAVLTGANLTVVRVIGDDEYIGWDEAQALGRLIKAEWQRPLTWQGRTALGLNQLEGKNR